MKLIKNACYLALIAASVGANATPSDIFTRTANGDIVKYQGATRINNQDQIKFYQEEMALATQERAKNVILLIGDGMGDSEITAARNFAQGAGGMFKGIDALPFTGQYTHYSLHKENGKVDYVTDSAASATAWSVGVKTYNGALGVDIYENPYPSLLKLAKNAGLKTGNVSTAEIQDATPAAQYANVPARKCYGPSVTSEKCPKQALENGGIGSISEQLVSVRADVTLGGGAKSFDEKITAGAYQGQTILDRAKAEGFTIVNTKQELMAIDKADGANPVLGLFAQGNMPIRLKGPQATYHGNLDKKVVKCEVNKERNAQVPTLADMTAKAIELLDNEKGFFLQVEGASIDKQAHASNPCGQFGETMDLDEAVQVALDFAKKDGHTLVIVTADHAHSTQIVYPDAKSTGFTQTVLTKDQSPMTISYGNSEDVDDTGHTGAQLRVAAYGPSAIKVLGLTDQTDMHFIIKDALGL